MTIQSPVTNDPADWVNASYLDDPVDHLEPVEPTVSEYRECALRLLAVLNGLDRYMSATHTGRANRRWLCASVALGLPSTRGETETAIAVEFAVSRASISKSVIQVLKLTGLEHAPAWGLKSQADREAYTRTNGRWRSEKLTDSTLQATGI